MDPEFGPSVGLPLVFLALLLLFGGVTPAPAAAQVTTATLAGRVVEAGGGAPSPVGQAVVGVVRAGETLRTALSDDEGRFRIEGLPAGEVTVRIQRIGYAVLETPVALVAGEFTTRDFALEPAAVALEGVAVQAERSRERARFEEIPGISSRELGADEIDLVPGIGEADPLRAIEVLPGVVSTSDFSSSFNVRGGSADQNLILVDGIPIFSPFHLGGFFSVFAADAVERAELQSGGFGAEHGGRVSSVLLIETDPGDGGELDVSAGLSLLSARATLSGGWAGLDGALGTERTRWMVSARRSYFDQLLRPITSFPYHFGDLQGTFETALGANTLLRLTGYAGRDVLDLTDFDPESFPLRIEWDWGNTLAGATLRRTLPRGGQLDLRASTTEFSTGLRFPDFQDTDFRSKVRQSRVAADAVLVPARGVEVGFGSSVDLMGYDNLARTGGTIFGEGAGDGTLVAGYARARWRPTPAWLAEGGVRFDHWRPAPGEPISTVSPRLALKRFFGEDRRWAVKASVGRYTQFLHSLRDEELPVGLDTWVLTGERAPHVESDQIQAGIEGFPTDGWNVALEGYWRDFRGVTTFNNGDDPNDEFDDLLVGTGTSYGTDLFVRRTEGTVTGWISLSLLKAERTFPDFLSGLTPAPEVTYSPIFDRRVDLDLVLRFPVVGWTAGLRLNVGSGTPYTRPLASYAIYQPRFLEDGGRMSWAGANETDDDGGGYAVVLGDRNAERYPVYHRLDLSFRRDFERSWATITPHIDLLNVYNRKNVLFYFYEYDRVPAQRSGISMFPLLPTFGVEVRF